MLRVRWAPLYRYVLRPLQQPSQSGPSSAGGDSSLRESDLANHGAGQQRNRSDSNSRVKRELNSMSVPPDWAVENTAADPLSTSQKVPPRLSTFSSQNHPSIGSPARGAAAGRGPRGRGFFHHQGVRSEIPAAALISGDEDLLEASALHLRTSMSISPEKNRTQDRVKRAADSGGGGNGGGSPRRRREASHAPSSPNSAGPGAVEKSADASTAPGPGSTPSQPVLAPAPSKGSSPAMSPTSSMKSQSANKNRKLSFARQEDNSVFTRTSSPTSSGRLGIAYAQMGIGHGTDGGGAPSRYAVLASPAGHTAFFRFLLEIGLAQSRISVMHAIGILHLFLTVRSKSYAFILDDIAMDLLAVSMSSRESDVSGPSTDRSRPSSATSATSAGSAVAGGPMSECRIEKKLLYPIICAMVAIEERSRTKFLFDFGPEVLQMTLSPHFLARLLMGFDPTLDIAGGDVVVAGHAVSPSLPEGPCPAAPASAPALRDAVELYGQFLKGNWEEVADGRVEMTDSLLSEIVLVMYAMARKLDDPPWIPDVSGGSTGDDDSGGCEDSTCEQDVVTGAARPASAVEGAASAAPVAVVPASEPSSGVVTSQPVFVEEATRKSRTMACEHQETATEQPLPQHTPGPAGDQKAELSMPGDESGAPTAAQRKKQKAGGPGGCCNIS